MKTTLLVGGNFGDCPKESSILNKLGDLFNKLDSSAVIKINGGKVHELEHALNLVERSEKNDLVIWIPNIDNTREKMYPKKPKGVVLIISKKSRNSEELVFKNELKNAENVKESTINEINYGIAVSRIFKMNANAVLMVEEPTAHDKPMNLYKFNLIDALGNSWIYTDDLELLVKIMIELRDWTSSSQRINSKQLIYHPDILSQFCNIIHQVSTLVEKERDGRYFGNASTRCSKLFPSLRSQSSDKESEELYDVLVSPRNISKDKISPEDFICIRNPDNSSSEIEYIGTKKPSIDSPTHLALYRELPDINYLIHGHAHIINCPYITKNYYPCGDMREISEILDIIKLDPNYPNFLFSFTINLKNHGFLIGANSLTSLMDEVENSTFKYREIGETIH